MENRETLPASDNAGHVGTVEAFHLLLPFHGKYLRSFLELLFSRAMVLNHGAWTH